MPSFQLWRGKGRRTRSREEKPSKCLRPQSVSSWQPGLDRACLQVFPMQVKSPPRRNRRCIPGPCRGRRPGQWDQHVCRKRGSFHKELVQEDSVPGCVCAGPRHDTHHLIAVGASEHGSGEGRGSLSQCSTHGITWKKVNPLVLS